MIFYQRASNCPRRSHGSAETTYFSPCIWFVWRLNSFIIEAISLKKERKEIKLINL
jgi:hypothetical protein